MKQTGICPKCGGTTEAEGVHNGVAYVYPPLWCPSCGWSERCPEWGDIETCERCTEYERCYNRISFKDLFDVVKKLKSRLATAEAKVAELETKLYNAEAYIQQLKRGLGDISATNVTLEAQAKELEAQAAAMREALEYASDYVHDAQCDEDPQAEIHARMCREALSSDAGRNLLERLQKLEDLANAVDRWNQVREELNSHGQAAKEGTLPEEIQKQDVAKMMAAINEMIASLQDLKALEKW